MDSARIIKTHLRRIVDDDSVAEVTAQHGEVLQVVAVDENTRISEHSVPDEAPLGVEYVQELLSVHLGHRKVELVQARCHHRFDKCLDGIV